jgi:hypothetical protein
MENASTYWKRSGAAREGAASAFWGLTVLIGGEGGITQNSLRAVLTLWASRLWRSVQKAALFVEP